MAEEISDPDSRPQIPHGWQRTVGHDIGNDVALDDATVHFKIDRSRRAARARAVSNRIADDVDRPCRGDRRRRSQPARRSDEQTPCPADGIALVEIVADYISICVAGKRRQRSDEHTCAAGSTYDVPKDQRIDISGGIDAEVLKLRRAIR